MDFITFMNSHNSFDKRELCAYHHNCIDESDVDVVPTNLSDAYISALVDLKGSISSNKKFTIRLSIKSRPKLIFAVQQYLQCGNISQSEPYRLRFESMSAIRTLFECYRSDGVRYLSDIRMAIFGH